MEIKEVKMWHDAYKYAEKAAENEECVTAEMYQDIQVLLVEAFETGYRNAKVNP